MFDANMEREIRRLTLENHELTEAKNLHHAVCVGAFGVMVMLRQALNECDRPEAVILATSSIEALCKILNRTPPPLAAKEPGREGLNETET